MYHLRISCFILFVFLLGVIPLRINLIGDHTIIDSNDTSISISSPLKKSNAPTKLPQKHENNSEKEEESEREFNEKENSRNDNHSNHLGNSIYATPFALHKIYGACLHTQQLKNNSFTVCQIYILHQVWLI